MPSVPVRLLLWFAFAAPLAYIAYIVSVVVHEIVGHGLVALALGGEFRGFAIMPDGMGWAWAVSRTNHNVVLAGGIGAGTLLGLVMLLVARCLRHPLARTATLLLAFCSFADALPYGFWNSLFPRPPGDVGRILEHLRNEPLRWALILTFGISYVVSTVLMNVLLFRCVDLACGPFSTSMAVLIAVCFGIGGAAFWYAFDWNQIISSVGRLPQHVGAGLQIATSFLLILLPRSAHPPVHIPGKSWAICIVGGWLTAGLLLTLLFAVLRHGVSWGLAGQ